MSTGLWPSRLIAQNEEHRRDKGLVDGTPLLGTSAPPFPLPEVGPRPPDTDPLSDHRGLAAYKREMAAVMVKRALTQAWGAARRP